jgi:hypothetical protein
MCGVHTHSHASHPLLRVEWRGGGEGGASSKSPSCPSAIRTKLSSSDSSSKGASIMLVSRRSAAVHLAAATSSRITSCGPRGRWVGRPARAPTVGARARRPPGPGSATRAADLRLISSRNGLVERTWRAKHACVCGARGARAAVRCMS